MAAPIIIRLNDKTIKDSESGCWLWMGGNDGCKGYGKIRYKSTKISVHRISAHLFLNFDLADTEALICHKCINKNCWNPDHLYIGDRLTNAQDSSVIYSITRANSFKTHCPRGHTLDGSFTSGGRVTRYCKTCDKLRKQ
jgi:hypothetical protein